MASTRSQSSPSPTPSLMQHKITSHTPSIQKFRGSVNGIVQDVEVFLESLDNHIFSLNLDSESDKLSHAKSFLDYTSGDLSHYCQSWNFRKLDSYDSFKTYLRSIYGLQSSDCLVRTLSMILRNCKDSNEHFSALGGRIYKEINSWKNQASSNTTWFPNNKISLENACQLIHLSLTLSHLPKQVVESFAHSFAPSDDLVTIKRQVTINKNKLPGLDLSVIDNTVSSSPIQSIAKVNVGQAQNLPAPIPQTQSKCKYCSKTNHVEDRCFFNSRYCFIHNSFRHGARDCYELKRQLNQSYGPRVSSRSPSRGRNQARNDKRRPQSRSRNRNNFFYSAQRSSNHSNRNFQHFPTRDHTP